MNNRVVAVQVALPLLLVILALAGCSAPKPDPPQDGGIYGTVQALEKAFTKAGGNCIVFKETTPSLSAAASARCDDFIYFSTYATSADRDEAISKFQHPAGLYRPKDELLAGRNWIIESVGSVETEGVQPALGGVVIKHSTS